jgi:ectoine hydroxylase-related dioxygenase (phytanoyl-CoA dioxygenase family)
MNQSQRKTSVAPRWQEDAGIMLKDEQVQAFRRDGFVVVPGMYDAAAVRDIDAWTRDIIAWPERPGRHMVYYEKSLIDPAKRVVSRVENFCPYHEGFDALMRKGAMIDAVGQLLGEPAVLFKEKINMKMPGGDGFKAHQDAQAGWNVYSNFHITALVAIDAATMENGCLEMAAGWHDKGLIGDEWRPLDDGAGSEVVYTPCPTAPGDVVFFDSYAPHRSAPNMTASPRRVLYVTYNRLADGDHRAQYYADKRKSFPPDIEREAGKEYVFRV